MLTRTRQCVYMVNYGVWRWPRMSVKKQNLKLPLVLHMHRCYFRIWVMVTQPSFNRLLQLSTDCEVRGQSWPAIS